MVQDLIKGNYKERRRSRVRMAGKKHVDFIASKNIFPIEVRSEVVERNERRQEGEHGQ